MNSNLPLYPQLRLRDLVLPLCGLAPALPAFAHGTEEFKVTAIDGHPGAQFGFAVGMSGERCVIGAPNHNGAGQAYIYFGNDPHADHFKFREEAKLLPLDLLAGDRFGHSAAISGDLAVVGAPRADANGTDSGVAYVFVRNPLDNTWSQEAKIVEPGAGAGVTFGKTVAIEGETIVIGQNGSAWVYVRDGGLWTQEGHLVPADGPPSFGGSVSIYLDRVAVGAPFALGRGANTGAAYVFLRQGGAWSQERKLWSNDGSYGDQFGSGVAIFNNTLVVGAMEDDDRGLNAGSAYEFHLNGGVWTQHDKMFGEATNADDRFGNSVSHRYNARWIGGKFDDIVGFPRQGGANLVLDVNNNFTEEVYIASDAADQDQLGFSVSAGDCWLIAGSPLKDDVLLGADSGAAYIYAVAHAEALAYNGNNVNPMCMTTRVLPVTGQDWIVDIDATNWPNAGSTQLLGVNLRLSTPQPTAFGEVLINRTSGTVITRTMVGTGLMTHVIPTPTTPWVIGYRIWTQGLIRDGSGALIGLCNAERVTIGCTEH
jgi:hypothetical protein